MFSIVTCLAPNRRILELLVEKVTKRLYTAGLVLDAEESVTLYVGTSSLEGDDASHETEVES